MAKLTSVPLDLAVSTLSFLADYLPQEQLSKIRAQDGKLAKFITEFFLRISPGEPTTDLAKVGNLFTADDWGYVVPGATAYDEEEEKIFPWSLETLAERDPLVDCDPWTVGHYHHKVYIPRKIKRKVGRNPYKFELDLLRKFGRKEVQHVLNATNEIAARSVLDQKPEYGWHLFRTEWGDRDISDQMLAYKIPDFATLFCLVMAIGYRWREPSCSRDQYVHIKSSTFVGSKRVYLTMLHEGDEHFDYTVHLGEKSWAKTSEPLQVWCRKKPIYELPTG